MKPTSTATPAAPNPPAASPATSTPPDTPKPGAAAQVTAPTPDVKLDQDGSYTFVYSIDPQITRRLLTRTGRGTKETMLTELPRYVERIVKRAFENEVY